MYILAIDLGTSGPKVALIDDRGDIAASAVRSVQTLILPPHGAEQDPEEIWSAVVEAAREVLARAEPPPDSVAGITCSSQYFSVVPVDAHARPVANLILWMDSRGAPHTRELYARHPDAFQLWADVHGMVPLPSGNDSLSHILYLLRERPEVYERSNKFLEPVDFVTARLSGACVSNLCSAFALLLTDNRDPSVSRYHEDLLRLSGVARDKLPELVPSNSCIGTLRPAVAAELGLPESTKVFAGINDTQAVSVGAATFRDRRGGVNIGTTAQVLAHVDTKKSDFDNEILSMPSPIAGRYMVMAENGLGAKNLDHFLRNVIFASDALADHGAGDPFAGVDALVATAPAGSDGVLYLPWLTGSGAPDGNSRMRGGFLNLSLQTTRAQLVRAILEGVSFNLRWLLPAVEQFAETRFEELMFAGGGAVSDGWAQIIADVMQRPVAQLADARYVNNRATAFLAFVELGILALEDIGRVCRVKRHYQPVAAHGEVYDRLFEQFRAAFEQTKPIFEALNG